MMSKFESIIVGLFVGVACPLLTFVVFWWSAALLHRHINDFSESIVIASALSGLTLGLLLDLLFLKRWVRMFYMANMWLMIVLYLASVKVVTTRTAQGAPGGSLNGGALNKVRPRAPGEVHRTGLRTGTSA